MGKEMVKVEVGNENFGRGRTVVKLHDTGEIEITNVRKLSLRSKLPQKVVKEYLKEFIR